MTREEAITNAILLAISTDPVLGSVYGGESLPSARDEFVRCVIDSLFRHEEDDTNPQTVAEYLVDDLLDGAHARNRSNYARVFDFVGLMWSSWGRKRDRDGFYH
jgi:hypothetical protein